MGTIAINEEILWFEVSVDDSSGVTEVDAIDELVHEQFDLLFGDGVLVLGEEAFEVMFGIFKN